MVLELIRVEAIFGGAIAGLGYGLSAYFRNIQKTGDKDKYKNLDWGKLTITVVVAAVCGGIAGARGIGISVVESSAAGGMVAVVVEKLYKGAKEWWMKRKATKAGKKK